MVVSIDALRHLLDRLRAEGRDGLAAEVEDRMLQECWEGRPRTRVWLDLPPDDTPAVRALLAADRP